MKVTTERVVPSKDVESFYPTYVAAWRPLLKRAAARHVLTEEEFSNEMSDPRIEKFLVRDDNGLPVALTTLTTDLSAVEWINAEYYRSRYPDVVARGAMFYLGYTLVDASRRRSNALLLMAADVNRRIAEAGGVLGFDICGWNDAHGIGQYTEWLSGSGTEVGRMDTQTYYTADFRTADRLVEAAGTLVDDGPDEGALHTVTLAERPDLAEDISGILISRWPAFMLAGRLKNGTDLEGVIVAAPEHQVLVLDADDEVQGVGLSVPVWWDGTTAGLPTGWDEAVTRGARIAAEGIAPNAACGLAVTVTRKVAGHGVAGRLIEALKGTTARAGGTALIVPVRPILKPRYPLVDMETYLDWRTPDDRLFDPWLRLHVRLGATVLAVSDPSVTLHGTVEEWRRWTGQTLPGPGSFVIADGLAPLVVENGTGTYREPNVWVAHQL